MAMIEVERLKKAYRVPEPEQSAFRRLFAPRLRLVEALADVSFSVEQGEAVAYIGPNGSGKSTTLKCLTGIVVPDAGSVRVRGMIPWTRRLEYSRQIGVLFGQKTLLFWDLPVIDALLLYKAIYGLTDRAFRQRVAEFQDAFGTDILLNTPVRRLSLGERMRCELLAALLHSPDVLFLDEPTIGLDVVARDQFHRFLKRYQRDHGLTLVLTTHQVSDIEELCPRVVVIQHGRVCFRGLVTELKARFGSAHRVQVTYRHLLDQAALEELAACCTQFDWDQAAQSMQLEVDREQISRVHRLLAEAVDMESLSTGEPPLEKILVEVFGRGETPSTG